MKATEIKRTACCGTGIIGAGFAVVFALKGFEVNLFSIRQSSLGDAEERIRGNFDLLVQKGLIEAVESEAALAKLKFTSSLRDAVSDVDFIQEQFAEKYEVKREMLCEIEKYASGDAIIASSTSFLRITDIQKGMQYPERFIGGHPYSSPHLSPLIEVVKGELTSDETADCVYEFYRLMGKEPVKLNREVAGFIASRLESALYRECIDLVSNGICTVEDVDKAFTFGPGLNLAITGPNLNLHLEGGKLGGVKGFLAAYKDLIELRMNDMAGWIEEPAGWPEAAEAGVLKEIENRTVAEGRTLEEITQFRDEMLIEFLKLHKKYKFGE